MASCRHDDAQENARHAICHSLSRCGRWPFDESDGCGTHEGGQIGNSAQVTQRGMITPGGWPEALFAGYLLWCHSCHFCHLCRFHKGFLGDGCSDGLAESDGFCGLLRGTRAQAKAPHFIPSVGTSGLKRHAHSAPTAFRRAIARLRREQHHESQRFIGLPAACSTACSTALKVPLARAGR